MTLITDRGRVGLRRLRFHYRWIDRDGVKVGTINQVLRDPDIEAAVAAEIDGQYCRHCYAQGMDPIGAGWMDFLAWLLEHADEIIALIQKLIDLFSKEK